MLFPILPYFLFAISSFLAIASLGLVATDFVISTSGKMLALPDKAGSVAAR